MPSTVGIVASGVEAGFSPLSLSPALWLDASDTSTITESGGSVSQWDDKSGNGNHVSQATAANQPSTGVATQNGLNVLSFGGNDNLVAASATDWVFLHDGTDHVIWMVSKRPSSAVAAGLIATSNLTGSRLGLFVLQTNVLFRHLLYGQSNVVTVSNPNSASSTADFQMVQIIADPDNATAADRSKIRVDAGFEEATNASTGGVGSSSPNKPLTVGSYGDNVNYLTGEIAEIVIVPTALSVTDIDAMRDYLTTKWAL